MFLQSTLLVRVLGVMAAGLPLVLGGVVQAAQPYQVEWAAQVGTAETEECFDVAIDGFGNAYITGFTTGDLSGPNAGQSDIFLTKFGPAGNVLWTQTLGTAEDDLGYALAIDGTGHIFITGRTRSDFDGTHAGRGDAFLMKLDPAGTELWVRQLGSSSIDESLSIAVDTAGNAYIGGYTGSSLVGPSEGGFDAFLAKFDPSGAELWSRQIGTTGDDVAQGVAVDGFGNVYLTGRTDEDLGGPYQGGYGDGFLIKYDTDGAKLWSRQIGTALDDQGYDLATDSTGNVYLTGPTSADLAGPSFGESDAFLMKFDPDGTELWSRQIGTTESDQGNSVAVDALDNVYLTGRTKGSLGGPSAGDWDAFVVAFDPLGNEQWSQQVGSPTRDFIEALALDASGNVFITGWTEGDLGGPYVGNRDAFLVKFAVPEPAALVMLMAGAVTLGLRRPGVTR